MTRKNPRAGEGPCPVCAKPVIFRASPTGKLTWACWHCDTSGYADQNGKGHKKLSALLVPEADDDDDPKPATKPATKAATKSAPAPTPTPKPDPEPAPPRRAPGSPFDLSQLMGGAP